MKAIITPLNEYFYNYQKYDGLNFFDRIEKKEPSAFTRFKKSMDYWSESSTKIYSFAAYYLLVIPIAASMILVLFFQAAFSLLLKFQFKDFLSNFKKLFMEKADALMDSRKNIKPELNIFQNREYSVFIYYNPKLIPKKTKKRKIFFEKLDQMKKDLGIAHVFEARNEKDVINTINEFEIETSESQFVADGNFDVTYLKKMLQSS